MKLCILAADHWKQLVAAYYQINLLRQRPWKFSALVYSWCIERVEHDKLDEWITELHELLPWQQVSDTAAAEEAESASFMSMMAKG